MMMNLQVFPDMTPQEEYEFLYNEGYTGQRNDQMFQYLRRELGFTGALNDMIKSWHKSGIFPSYIAGQSPVMVMAFYGDKYYHDDFYKYTLDGHTPAMFLFYANDTYAEDL